MAPWRGYGRWEQPLLVDFPFPPERSCRCPYVRLDGAVLITDAMVSLLRSTVKYVLSITQFGTA